MSFIFEFYPIYYLLVFLIFLAFLWYSSDQFGPGSNTYTFSVLIFFGSFQLLLLCSPCLLVVCLLKLYEAAKELTSSSWEIGFFYWRTSIGCLMCFIEVRRRAIHIKKNKYHIQFDNPCDLFYCWRWSLVLDRLIRVYFTLRWYITVYFHF